MKHQLNLMGRPGHSTVAEWEPANKVEVKTAEEMFRQLQGDPENPRHLFFDATQPQHTKDPMKVFDPEVKEIIGFGQPQGG